MEALIIAGTAVKAIGAIQQGAAAESAANYNAAMMERDAVSERQLASEREAAKRRETTAILASQRAAFAQSGGGMGGSAADVMRQSGINAELDALTLRYEGDMRARGLESGAVSERYAGKQAKTQSYFNAAGTILGGFGDYQGYQETKRYRTQSMENDRRRISGIN